jgi:1-acyl-sn-glycerol-3-phosphate acyltransferase
MEHAHGGRWSRRTRAGARIALLSPWTLCLFLVWLLGAPLALAAGRIARWRARVQQGWARGMCRIVGVRVAVEGPRPRGSCLLVSNHLSYVDVLVLASLFPCAFVAKAQIARWPVVGFLARAMGTLFVEREQKRSLGPLNARLSARLARGEALVLFPEGTSTAGEGVLPFRPALLEPAASLGLAVRHAALRYTTAPGDRPAREAVCWWGDTSFLAHLGALLGLARIEARVRFGAEPVAAADRKELAVRLERAVRADFEPLARFQSSAPAPSHPKAHPEEHGACAPRAG